MEGERRGAETRGRFAMKDWIGWGGGGGGDESWGRWGGRDKKSLTSGYFIKFLLSPTGFRDPVINHELV